MIDPHSNRNIFKEKLLTDREKMNSERNTMSDRKFWQLYWISATMVGTHMWQRTVLITNRKVKRKVIDTDKVNELRKNHTDTYIANLFNCGTRTLLVHCGGRKSLWFKDVRVSTYNVWDVVVKKEPPRTVPRYVADRNLKQDKWDNTEETPYWMTDEVIIAGDAPIGGIKLEKNTYWHPY